MDLAVEPPVGLGDGTMDITTVLMLAASAVVGLAGAWLTTMAMEGQTPAQIRLDAEREHDRGLNP
jgi:hypothetical protein